MRTRKLTKLYAIAVNNTNELESGICELFLILVADNLISTKEHSKLSIHFHKSKPTIRRKYRSFMCNEMWEGGVFWWKIGEKEIRKQFLIRLREDTKPWYDKIWWI